VSLLLDTVRNSFRGIGVYGTVFANKARGLPTIIINPRREEALHEHMRFYAGISTLRTSPFHYNYTEETREMRFAYRKWAVEPTVKSALLGKVYSVASLDLHVNPIDKASPREQEKADCLRHSLRRNDTGFSGLLFELIMPALMDGWSLCEPVFDYEDKGRFRGKVVVSKFKSKDTRFITPVVDAYRNVVGYYNAMGNYGHRFSPDDFVYFSHLPMFRNPTGTSDLRAAYRAMQMIPAVLKLRMIFLDKYIGPFLKATLKNKALKAKMADELEQARADGFIVLEDGATVEALDLATRGTADFQAGLDDLRKEAATAISGAFLHMMTAADPNARGDSGVQQDTVDLFVWYLAEQAISVINHQLAPKIIGLNYGFNEEVPTCTLEAVRPSDIVADLAIDEALDRMGVDTSREELLDRARRSPPKTPQDSVQAAKQARQQPPGGPNPDGGPQGGGNPYLPQQGSGGVPAMFAEPPAGHELIVLPSGQFASILSVERMRIIDATDPAVAELQAYDSFAEQTGFTGTKKDRLGRTFCYQNGRRVPCKQHSDNPRNQPVKVEDSINARTLARGAFGKAVGEKGATALWEINNLSEHLKNLSGEELGHMLGDLTGAGSYSFDPSAVDANRKAIVGHLQMQRKDWWKKNQRAPEMADILPDEPKTAEIDYRQKNPDHPIAVQIRNDTDGRKLVSDFTTQFGEKYKLGQQAAELTDQHWEAYKKSTPALTEYTQALLAWSAHVSVPTSKRGKGHQKEERELKKLADDAKAKSDALSAAAADLAKKRDAAAKAAREVSADARKWLSENVKPAEKSVFVHEFSDKEVRNPFVSSITEWIPFKPSDAGRKAVEDGFGFVESISSGVKARILVGGTPTGRAFYQANTHSIREADGRPLVALSAQTAALDDGYSTKYTAEVAAHEIGHHVELAIPGLADKAAAFRDYRTGSEPPTRLNTLPGGDHYRESEIGKKDDFDRVFDGSTNAYYVGKSYGAAPGTSTEIVSMGLEQLYRDPVKFAQNDPEYFQWLVTNLRGAK
jgi:hypothetical protein